MRREEGRRGLWLVLPTVTTIFFLLLLVMGSQSITQAAPARPFIVEGGLWSQEAVVEAVASNPTLRQALEQNGVNPDALVSVEEVQVSGFRQTVDANLEPSRLWIKDGEAVWQVTDASGASTVVKKECGNPPVVQPPPPPAPKKGAIVQVRKECGPESGPFGPCGEWKAVRIEAKAIGRELWVIDPRSSAVEFNVPAEWFEGRENLELTVSEEPKPGWTPKLRWQIVEARPGDSLVVTFRNIAPAPPGDGNGNGPPPSSTPTPGPSPTSTPGPEPTSTPNPEPSPTPSPEKGNNGIGQEKCNNENNCTPDGQPPGLQDKPGLDNDRTGRTDSDPGTPTDENQSRGGNQGETPGQSSGSSSQSGDHNGQGQGGGKK